MLWIALHLPLLSLESFAATLSEASDLPLALMDAQQIVAANASAQALGVRPGLQRATALALAPQLLLGRADPARDAQAITAVAHAALAYTPQVTLQHAVAADAAPDTVLLEVQASLRFFSGRERRLAPLLQHLQRALAPLRHRLQVASAPTPLGATLLARAATGQARHCADLEALRRALDEVPVWLLGPGRAHWEALQGMGLRTLGDLHRLPRAGVARRFGEALLADLDRARGERPDPREPVLLPPSFESRLELFARADSTAQVLHGAGMLLARFTAWLTAQHVYASGFTLAMQHEPRWRADVQTPAATPLDVALASPSRDAVHLQSLLRERLAALQLPAPTLELHLVGGGIVRRAPPNGELFATPSSEREGLLRLVERLQARLGSAQVQRLAGVADHRPERASCTQALALARAGAARPNAVAAVNAARPVWLLATAEPLPERQSRPVLDGRPLQLLSGPERIEAGWWDAALAERDYFIAQAADGALVWIYRTRLPPLDGEGAAGWFLHGRFG